MPSPSTVTKSTRNDMGGERVTDLIDRRIVAAESTMAAQTPTGTHTCLD